MGQAASSPSGGPIHIANPRRFGVKCLQVGKSPDGPALVCSIDPGQAPVSDPMPKYNVSRSDEKPLEFVLDPSSPQELLLKAQYEPSLAFRFKLTISVMPSDGVRSLTFITANTRKEIDYLVDNSSSELLSNPNLQNEDNIAVLGDFVAEEQPLIKNVDFTWVWDAPHHVSKGGLPVFFCFAEYDKNQHRLRRLASAAVWIGEPPLNDRMDRIDHLDMLLSPVNGPQLPSLTDLSSPDNSLLSPTNELGPSIIPMLSPPIPIGNLSNGSNLSEQLANNGPYGASHTAYSQPNISSVSTSTNPAKSTLSSSSGTLLAGPIPEQTNREGATLPATAQNVNASSIQSSHPIGSPPAIVVSKEPKSLGRAPIRATRPHPDRASQPEDGPAFRSSLNDMETSMVQLKATVKQILKRSLLVRERLQTLIESEQWLVSAIVAAGEGEMTSLRPFGDWLMAPSTNGSFNLLLKQQKLTLRELNSKVIQPLQEFYEQEIKTFEARKREFVDESSQYYSWMSRYLGNTKKGYSVNYTHDKDAKYAEKRRQFELARFDYYTYLMDLNGGRKQQSILLNLALFAHHWSDSLVTIGKAVANKGSPLIDECLDDIKEASKEWEQQRVDRELKRRELERTSPNNNGGSHLSSSPPSNVVNSSGPFPVAGNSSVGTGGSEDDLRASQIYKEGLLWALSRPTGIQANQPTSKQGLKWHKYWVVQSEGQLCEYANWKQGMDLHNEPINLLLASVREAKSADRRFCFEIVTPQYKRIYQATSDEDMKSWIHSIVRGITSMLEQNNGGSEGQHSSLSGSGSAQSTAAQPLIVSAGGPKKLESLTRKLSLKEHKPRVAPISTHWHGSTTNNYIPAGPLSASASSQPTPLSIGTNNGGPLSSQQDAYSTFDLAAKSPLLTRVQTIASNRLCADCGTSRNVDWVSINLLTVLCIECSGAHRSLGSHISKVRSLNLDSFSSDWEQVILNVSNSEINNIWESQSAKAEKSRPRSSQPPNSNARLKFVSEKYVEKQFATEVEKPNTALRKAIKEQSLSGILHALVSCANPNGTSDAGEPMIIDALRCAPPGSKCFPTAELLYVQGATIPVGTNINGLSDYAKLFVQTRFS